LAIFLGPDIFNIYYVAKKYGILIQPKGLVSKWVQKPIIMSPLAGTKVSRIDNINVMTTNGGRLNNGKLSTSNRPA
jgi:hypothetical protein